jgi:uncharacterized membrane protein
MAIAAVIAGLPLPIINLIAAFGYYLGYRKSSYFVRWHCIQSIIGQAILIPFNSLAFAWTFRIFILEIYLSKKEEYTGNELMEAFCDGATSAYWVYIAIIILVNIMEFIIVIYAAIRVRKGHDVRWPIIASITDKLTSKENRDPYTI